MHIPPTVNPLDLKAPGRGNLSGYIVNPLFLSVLGVILIVLSAFLGVASYVANGYEIELGGVPSGGAPLALTVLAFVSLVAGVFCIIIAFVAVSPHPPREDEDAMRNESQNYYGVPRGGTHYHEVIKVRCRYCGTLNEVTASNCIACGGNL